MRTEERVSVELHPAASSSPHPRRYAVCRTPETRPSDPGLEEPTFHEACGFERQLESWGEAIKCGQALGLKQVKAMSPLQALTDLIIAGAITQSARENCVVG